MTRARTSNVRLAVGLFLLIATVRLTLALMSAVEIPFYDAWETTIDQMALPLLAHRFDAAVLFATHNEHVFVPTRLVDLFALAVGDVQYDAVTVCLINQVFYAAVAAVLITVAVPLFATRERLFVVAATLYAGIPYDFENLAQPLTSMYVFLLAFSTALIVVCAVARTWVGGISGIVAFGSLAVLSAGSGCASAAVGLGVVALRWRRAELQKSKALVYAAALVACIAIGLYFASRAVAVRHAIGAMQIAQVAIVCIVWIPTGIMVWRIATRRQSAPIELAVAAVSVWGALEIGAMILARPEFHIWLPISRYMAILGVAAFANVTCLMRLHVSSGVFGFASRFALPLVLCAIVGFAPYAWSWFSLRAGQVRAQSDRVQRYTHAGDSHAFDDASPDELAFPSRDWLQRELDNPAVRYVLGDEFGTRPEPSAVTRHRRAATAFLGATRGFWWIAMTLLASALLSDFFRSTGRHAPRERERA